MRNRRPASWSGALSSSGSVATCKHDISRTWYQYTCGAASLASETEGRHAYIYMAAVCDDLICLSDFIYAQY